MALYKYVPLDRVDILTHQLIRYSQAGAFNDPFEKPLFRDNDIDVSSVERQVDASFPEIMKAKYDKLPRLIKMSVSFSSFLTMAEAQKKSALPAVQQMIRHSIDSATDKRRAAIGQADRQFGILSLTDKPDSLPMWSRYAANHRGMVIELDEAHPTFDERQSPDDDIRHLRPVRYGEVRPEVDGEHFSFGDHVMTKGLAWDHEREWRIVKPVTDATRVVAGSPYDVCLFALPASAVRAVILGVGVPAEGRAAVGRLLSEHPPLRHIRLLQATMDERRFALSVEAMPAGR